MDIKFVYENFKTLEPSEKVQFLKDNYKDLSKFSLNLDRLIQIWSDISEGKPYKFKAKNRTPGFTMR